MLNSGVLKRTLKVSPLPNRSEMELLDETAGEGLRGAAIGAGLKEAELEAEEVLGLNLPPEEPTALDTVLEMRGWMLLTTWDTMSLELKLLNEVVMGAGAAANGGGVARTATGRREAPLTALLTVEEIKGWTWLTTELTMLSALKELELLLPKLFEEEDPKLDELPNEELPKPELELLNPELELPNPELEPEKEEVVVVVCCLTGLALIST